MFIGAIVFFYMGISRKVNTVMHVLTFFIAAVSACAYYAEWAGLGVEYKTTDTTPRVIFWAHYLDWVITGPVRVALRMPQRVRVRACAAVRETGGTGEGGGGGMRRVSGLDGMGGAGCGWGLGIKGRKGRGVGWRKAGVRNREDVADREGGEGGVKRDNCCVGAWARDARGAEDEGRRGARRARWGGRQKDRALVVRQGIHGM
jgi:hypothetical protein